MEEEEGEIIFIPISEVRSILWSGKRANKLKHLRGDIKIPRLAEILKEKGVEISRQYLARLENDPEVRGISPELALGLCGVLGVPLSELLCLRAQKIIQLVSDESN